MNRAPKAAFALCVGLASLTPAPAAEWHVGAGQPFGDIRSALAAAGPHDVIVVHRGTYREGTLVVDKPVVLVGRDQPRLDGESRGDVLNVTAPDVTIRGFVVSDSGSSSLRDFAGINVVSASRVTLEDNRIEGCSFGLYLSKARDAIVRRNVIHGTPAAAREIGNGIHAWSSERLEIAGNRVEHHRDGIYLEYVNESAISRNTVSDNQRYGLHFMFSHHNAYRQNTFVRNGAGVAVMYSRDVRMEANRFSHSWGSAAYGLLLKELSDSRIAGNVFESNSVGVTIQSSTRMVFERNEFRRNGWALQIESSSTDNTYRQNNFVGNAFDLTTGGTLQANRFEGNFWDRAELYDLNRDGIGDVPHRPLSLYAKLVDRVPPALLLLRSPLVHFLDRAERVFPSITPDRLADPRPVMRPHALNAPRPRATE